MDVDVLLWVVRFVGLHSGMSSLVRTLIGDENGPQPLQVQAEAAIMYTVQYLSWETVKVTTKELLGMTVFVAGQSYENLGNVSIIE